MWSDDDDYFSYSPYYFGSDTDDSDDVYCGYSSGEDLYMTALRDPSRTETIGGSTLSVEVAPQIYEVPSLQDLCCRFIALKFPFAFVEHRSPPIPDELQLKIIEFSFPDDEDMIRKYAEFSRSSVDFYSAKTMLDSGKVKDLNQIGFRLSASVEDRKYGHGRNSDGDKNYVTILFDRGKITSAHCSCDFTTNWCSHVVATCLARIKNKNSMTVHMPVSDSLNTLDREQLLKFSQYLLSEHQNEPVVETAQKLLDKLLSRQNQEQEEDINKIAGAPDPTAGPGLDEEAHWFVCKNGFKARLESLMYENIQDLGFEMYHEHDPDCGNGSDVKDVWERNILQQPLIRDEMDIQLDNERSYHGGYPSSKRQSVLQVLETISDLLVEDFLSAVSALTMCTEQLIERLTRVRDGRDIHRRRQTKSQSKDKIKLFGSLAVGFTPRMSDCRTLSDEVSRLWRLAVLIPGISAKQRQGVRDQLRTLNEAVSAVLVSGPLRPWHGLEVAIRLATINWDSPDFQRVLKGEWTFVPTVSSWMAIELTCQSKRKYVSEWIELDRVDSNIKRNLAQDDAVTSLTFYHPHCIALGPLFGVDIHSVCSMIEALNLEGEHEAAMRLTVAVSYAIVSTYKNVLFGMDVASSFPVSARCTLGIASRKTEVKIEQSSQSDSPMEVEVSAKPSTNRHIWPEDTILSLSTFAFLYDLLSKKFHLADTCIAEMKSRLTFEGSSAYALDCLRTSVSLGFQLGVVGLYLQRFPAPSPHLEVEEYNYECWLTYKLICCSPGESDLRFLAQLAQHVPQCVALPTLVPPSSPCRVIFHHLFKGASATLSNSLTEHQNIGLQAALSVLAHKDENTVRESSMTWMLFQYSNCRLWAKLAEVVLRSLSDSSEMLRDAVGYILKPEGMLGAQNYENISPDSRPTDALSYMQNIAFLKGKSRVAYCLARALSERNGNSIRQTKYKTEIGRHRDRRESFEVEMPRKIMKSGVDRALKLCAIEICAHSLWLQKLCHRDHTRSDIVRWLTDFVVTSGADCLECLVKCRGDVSTFLEQSDLLNLCERILNVKGEPETRVKVVVQNILSSLLQESSRAGSADDMRQIVSFCTDRHRVKHRDLLPLICKELRTLEVSEAFLPFEVVMKASDGMFDLYKDRLASAERDNRREWTRKGMDLKRLFSEGSTAGDESDIEDNDSWSAESNPYRTREVHPFLETAFDLGTKGIERLKQDTEELEENRSYRYSYSRSCHEHLSAFCRLVCYLVDKKWLTDEGEAVVVLKSPKREKKAALNASSAKPGCSHWEDNVAADSESPCSKVSQDSCYLHKFVSSLINCVDNPMWLFHVLQELGEQLCADTPRGSPTLRQKQQDTQINQACQSYPPVKLLLQKNLDAFSKLLLGPKLSTLVKDVRLKYGRPLSPSSFVSEFAQSKLMNTRLQEVLVVAKRAFNISDASGATFKSLTEELVVEHPLLKTLLDRVLNDEKLSSSFERELLIRGSFLPTLFAQGLLPVFLDENEYY